MSEQSNLETTPDHDKNRRSSFFFNDDEEDGQDTSDRESQADSSLLNQLHLEFGPFSKVLSVLHSARDQLASSAPQQQHQQHQQEPESSAAAEPERIGERRTSVTSDDWLMEMSINEQLDWCIGQLEEYIDRALSTSHEKIQRILHKQLDRTTLTGNEELAKWVKTHYMVNTFRRRRTAHKSSQSESERASGSPSHSISLPTGVKSYYQLVSTDMVATRRLPALLAVHEEEHEEEEGAASSEKPPLDRKDSGTAVGSAQKRRSSHAKYTLTPMTERQDSENDTDHGHITFQDSHMVVCDCREHRSRSASFGRAISASVVNQLSVEETKLPEFTPECIEFLKTLDNWGFDIFHLDTLSGGFPLTSLCLQILERQDLFAKLRVDKLVATRYLVALEQGYAHYPDVPYHTNVHAADVTHSTFGLLESAAMAGVFSDLEVFSAVIAAAAHDVGHFGLTNQFLSATQHPLAILYNDQSILENHHAATAFQLMQHEGHNILEFFDIEDKADFRKMMIAMILSTDMGKHFQFLSDFRTMIEAKRKQCASGPIDLVTASEEDKLLTLCGIVHCADLGASTKPWNLCEAWCLRVMNEFFDQGDKERELGLEVGPLNSREKTCIPKSQVGFIDFIVLPLWETWDELAGVRTVQTNYLLENRAEWQRRAAEEAEKGACVDAKENGDGAPPAATVNDASEPSTPSVVVSVADAETSHV